MEESYTLKHVLAELAILQIALNKKGGPAEDGQMLEQILKTQDDILKDFQLPLKKDYLELLWFEEFPRDFELEERIIALHQSATEYLLSPAIPDIKLLNNAQETGEDAFTILPELKIKTHIYTIFVYEKIFLRRKDTTENVLADLRLANTDENLDLLGRLILGGEGNELELEQRLIEKGIKYTQQFIISNSEFLSDDDY